MLTTVLGGTRYTAAWYLGRLEWAIAATSFLAVLLSNVYRILLALSANNTLLHAQTVSDELTGLLNRRGFNVRLEEEIRRLQRKGEPLSVLIVDVDDFKRYNDTFGHPAGDAALRAVARIILSTLRRSPDCACRIGGEEFAIVLPESDEPGAIAVGERVRRGVERLGILQGKGASHAALTVSVGVASTEDRPGADAEALTRAADRALYEAKESGRNCVRLATTAKRSLHAVASGLGVGTF
ncbi:MAG: GGDEF domain-containing protein [Candidatus Eremiobacteraeota bacterium]|nr:GGDEF domain-containing protein [Candidatus Eremiobacteraeota bacterium]